jgi:hypothetical protein
MHRFGWIIFIQSVTITKITQGSAEGLLCPTDDQLVNCLTSNGKYSRRNQVQQYLKKKIKN